MSRYTPAAALGAPQSYSLASPASLDVVAASSAHVGLALAVCFSRSTVNLYSILRAKGYA